MCSFIVINGVQFLHNNYCHGRPVKVAHQKFLYIHMINFQVPQTGRGWGKQTLMVVEGLIHSRSRMKTVNLFLYRQSNILGAAGGISKYTC